jgi:hypothetical protein
VYFLTDGPNTKTDFCGLIFEQRNGMFEMLQLLLIGMLDTFFFWGGAYIHDQAFKSSYDSSTYNPYNIAPYCVIAKKQPCTTSFTSRKDLSCKVNREYRHLVCLNLSTRISQLFSSIFLSQ